MNNVHFENKTISHHFFWFIWVMYSIVYMTKSCFSAAMASIVFEGVMTKSQTGLIISVFYLVYAPLQIYGGMLADKYDPEKLILIGLGGSGIANLIIYLNHNFYVMLIVWALNAVVQFAVWPSIFKILSSQLEKSYRKSAAFYITFSSSAGVLLAYFAAAVLPGWEYNFLMSGLLLILLCIVFYFVCKKTDRYMVDDGTDNKASVEIQQHCYKSTFDMFLKCGFFILIISMFLRFVADQALKTYLPTMLMESYEGVSPSIANVFNMFAVAISMLGTLIAKFIYPRFIKNEALSFSLMLLIALPFTFALTFVGRLDIKLMIISASVIACAITATNLFKQYYCMQFTKYGKNATAAGIVNCADSFGIVVQSYCVGRLADGFGWNTVTVILFIVMAGAVVLSFISVPLWIAFKKNKKTSVQN